MLSSKQHRAEAVHRASTGQSQHRGYFARGLLSNINGHYPSTAALVILLSTLITLVSDLATTALATLASTLVTLVSALVTTVPVATALLTLTLPAVSSIRGG